MKHRRRADTCYIAGYGLVVLSLVFVWTDVFSLYLGISLAILGLLIALVVEPIVMRFKGGD